MRTKMLVLSFTLFVSIINISAVSTVASAEVWYESYDFAAKGVLGYWPFDGDLKDVSGQAADGVGSGAVGYTGGAIGLSADVSGLYVTMGDVCQPPPRRVYGCDVGVLSEPRERTECDVALRVGKPH